MRTDVILPYTGLSLDRAGGSRADRRVIDAALSHPDATVHVLWRDSCLVGGSPPRPVSLPAATAEPVLAAGQVVFLGKHGAAGVFAADLSELDERDAIRLAGADATCDVRRLVGELTPQRSATLAYARGILHWNRNQRFCGACGGATESRDAGHLRCCRDCGKLLFPRIEPAIIVLVESAGPPRRCLLARHRGAAADAYSTLAGFVEVGESLEDAVRRELAEEAGVRLASVRYQASQAWPFPAGLMVGFRAVAASDAVEVDQDELLEARWFRRDEVLALLDRHRERGTERRDSIESHLIDSWIADR